jgi:diaminopimelate epimerase
MEFTKIQGAGNDFILIEPRDVDRDWPNLAVAMCDRHFGVGGDGILLVLPTDRADIRMRIFNADGSEAEACGNGLRCVAKYSVENNLVKESAGGISIETMAGIRQAKIECKEGKLSNIQVAMGKPKFLAEEIPVAIRPTKEKPIDITPLLSYPIVLGRTMRLYFVNMGNPHAVFFTQDNVDKFPLAQIGPEVEHDKIFPNRVNFEVANVIGGEEIKARVWERGAGETLACGSGACAITVAARLLGYIGDKVDIKLPGGTLNLEWDGEHEVMLGGPTEIVFTGTWPEKANIRC